VNIFWVPEEARWSYLQANAKNSAIGRLLDNAMEAIERDNKSLRGCFPRTMPGQPCGR
jgi:type I restriction enzyme M protein